MLGQVGRDDLVVVKEMGIKEYDYRWRKIRCVRDKDYSFPYRTLDICNGLNDEIVNLKEKLEEIRYENTTSQRNN